MGKHAPRTGDEGQVKTAKVSKNKIKKSVKTKNGREKKSRREEKLVAAIEEEVDAVDEEVGANSKEIDSTGNGIETDGQLTTSDANQLGEQQAARKKKKEKKEKKQKKSKTLKAKPQKQVQEQVTEQGSDPSRTTTNLADEAQPGKEAKTKQERSKARAPSETSGSADEEPLWTIDTNPTKAEMPAFTRANLDQDSRKSPESQPVLNRAARRRVLMIEQQKKSIMKKVIREGQLEAGSDQFDEEVARRLEGWAQDKDGKAVEKMERARKLAQSRRKAKLSRNKKRI